MDLLKLKVFTVLARQNAEGIYAINLSNMVGMINLLSLMFAVLFFILYPHPVFYCVFILCGLSVFFYFKRQQLRYLLYAYFCTLLAHYSTWIILPFLILHDHHILKAGSQIFLPFMMLIWLNSFAFLRADHRNVLASLINAIQPYGPFKQMVFNDSIYLSELKQTNDKRKTSFFNGKILFLIILLFNVFSCFYFNMSPASLWQDFSEGDGGLVFLMTATLAMIFSINMGYSFWVGLSCLYYRKEISVYFQEKYGID